MIFATRYHNDDGGITRIKGTNKSKTLIAKILRKSKKTSELFTQATQQVDVTSKYDVRGSKHIIFFVYYVII